MGVDAEIRPKQGRSLGSAVQVRSALEAHFPGIVFVRFENESNGMELKHFAQSLVPSWVKIKLVGPKAPFAFQGNLEGVGWAMQVHFDDAESVPIAYVSFYGNFDAAQPRFDSLFAVLPWKLKVF